jgi:hypothetical protein
MAGVSLCVRRVEGVGLQQVKFLPGNWVAPAGSYRSDGGTYRATFGGTLTARELWFGGIWFLSRLLSSLGPGDARQWPCSLWCFLPEVELGTRGFDLVFGDLPRRVFPSWY